MNCEETARSHAREINDIWHGLRYYCPACGRQVAIDPDNYGEVHYCPDCEDEELEEYDLFAWLDDQLEISKWIHTDRHGPVSDVWVAITLGGPNVYLDTENEKVRVYWGFDYAEAPVEEGACEEVVRLAQEDWDAQ